MAVMCSSNCAHRGCMLAVTPISANRARSSGWTTRRCAMWCRRPVRPFAPRAASNASRASHTARSPTACTCTWNPAASSRATCSRRATGHHAPGGEVTGLGCPEVRRGRVCAPRVVTQDGVLPGRDAQRVEVSLGHEQRLVVLLRGGRRDVPFHQRHRALVQGAGRVSRRVPLEPSVHRVGGRAVEPGDLERPGADPRAVVVTAGQEHQPAGCDDIEISRLGAIHAERGLRPAAAAQPVQLRMRVGVGLDGFQALLAGVQPGQVAPHPLEAALHGMHVGVLEPGRTSPPARSTTAAAPAACSMRCSSGPTARIRPWEATTPHPGVVPLSVEDRPVAKTARWASLIADQQFGFRGHGNSRERYR